jgi:hypothetical protein
MHGGGSLITDSEDEEVITAGFSMTLQQPKARGRDEDESSGDEDFVPGTSSRPAPRVGNLHPILGSRSFPVFDLISIEHTDREVRKVIRKVIKAVHPGIYGKGNNSYWRRQVSTASLKSVIGKQIAGSRETIAPSDIVDWFDMSIGNNVNKGPDIEAFKVPGVSWIQFKVLILDHHGVLCGVDNSSTEPAAKKARWESLHCIAPD